LFQRLDGFNAEVVNTTLAELETEARAFVSDGAGTATTTTKLTAFMRYSGQGWEIPVVVPYRSFSDADHILMMDAFEQAYRVLFGRVIDGLAVEITNWSITVASVMPDVISADRHLTGQQLDAQKTREFFDAALRKTVTAHEVERADLTPGRVVHGPAVVVESETSTIVTSGYSVIGQGDGSLWLIRKGAQA
jgi:N-methylhydantoinase A